MSTPEDPTALVPVEGILSYRQGVPEQAAQFDFLLGEWEARTTRYRPDGSEIGSYSFSGRFEKGEMLLEGSGRTLAGEPVEARVRFFDITPASFQWENRVSLDAGGTWYRDSTISARRA